VRYWSIWKKIVRHDTVCSRRTLGFARMRTRSDGGTFSITSTSPESSAAVRAGSFDIMRNVTLSHAGFLSQYPSKRASSTRSPRVQRTNL
jgi:hypothetical protein